MQEAGEVQHLLFRLVGQVSQQRYNLLGNRNPALRLSPPNDDELSKISFSKSQYGMQSMI
jgi:hypothetical protein